MSELIYTTVIESKIYLLVYRFKNGFLNSKERKDCDVTASELGSLLGVSPYCSRFKFWFKKMLILCGGEEGIRKRFGELLKRNVVCTPNPYIQPMLEFGTQHEKFALQAFSDWMDVCKQDIDWPYKDVKVVPNNNYYFKGSIYTSKDGDDSLVSEPPFPNIGCAPDGFLMESSDVFEKEGKLQNVLATIEVKCPYTKRFFQPHDHIPDHYLLQVMTQIHLTGVLGGYFVSWTPSYIRVFFVPKLDFAWHYILPLITDFITTYIHGSNKPPETIGKNDKKKVTDLLEKVKKETYRFSLWEIPINNSQKSKELYNQIGWRPLGTQE
jgi:hypothetical protein